VPVEAKPLFRPDVLRSHLADFYLPPVDKTKLSEWADLIATGRLDGCCPPENQSVGVASFIGQSRVNVARVNAEQAAKVVPPLQRETHSNLPVKWAAL
jgi:hypothetical protein